MKVILFALLTLLLYSCNSLIVNNNDSEKVTGGQIVSIGQYPWQVAVLMNEEFICGGALINYLFVMTSAECIEDYKYYYKNISILVGGLSNDPEVQEKGRYKIKSTIIHTHPKYNVTHFKDYNNLGLIALSYPVPDGENIGFINIPDSTEEVFIDDVVTLSGWGGKKDDETSETLQFVQLQVMDHQSCADFVQGDLDNRTICTEPYPKNSACKLDLGGALMRYNGSNVPFLMGVASTAGCQNPGIPTVFTDIASHRQWIRNMVGI